MESDALNDTVHPVVNKCLNRSGDCLLSWSQIGARLYVRCGLKCHQPFHDSHRCSAVLIVQILVTQSLTRRRCYAQDTHFKFTRNSMSQLKGVEISLKPIAGGVNRVLPTG
jgi:hypothetical protein